MLSTGDEPHPLKLLDEGHDVWYVYNRGSVYGLQHETKSQYDADFWDFDLEDYALGDTTAALDFVYS